MRLNELKPTPGSRPKSKRIARGQGSDMGKTAGRGHTGQKSRSGGYHKVGFEGGQMPLQRRVPKRGFNSHKIVVAEIRLDQLNRFSGEVSLDSLREARLVSRGTRAAKVLAAGELTQKITLRGIAVSKGARSAIEAQGGEIAE